MLKRKYPNKREELRFTILHECSNLFDSEININKIMKFVKLRLGG